MTPRPEKARGSSRSAPGQQLDSGGSGEGGGGGKGEGDQTHGDGRSLSAACTPYRIQMMQECTPETYTILLTDVTAINLTKEKQKRPRAAFRAEIRVRERSSLSP